MPAPKAVNNKNFLFIKPTMAPIKAPIKIGLCCSFIFITKYYS